MTGLGVEIKGVVKKYGTLKAVDDVSLRVSPGELFGIIGPDGAGKSTLFRMIATLLLPDSGKITIGDRDVVGDYRDVRSVLGYMPGKFSLYQDLTVRENLDFYASVFGTTVGENYHFISDIYRMLKPFEKRLARHLSGGMKQKLALCCSLIHRPQVLLLDEPTTGVDPVSRYEFWEILKRLSVDGMTIIVSTPYMDEAYKCSRMAMMIGGKVIKEGTPDDIIAGYNGKLWKVSGREVYGMLLAVKAYCGVVSCDSFGDSLHVVVRDDIEGLRSYLREKGYDDVTVEATKPTVEDCFIELVRDGCSDR